MNLPYPNTTDIKLFSNEYVNGNTLNRALLRLYYNDLYLSNLSTLDPIDSPTVANMLLVSTGPSTYVWQTDTQIKTTLNITDTIFGLSDVDETAGAMINGYALAWDSTKTAFVGRKAATSLNDLDDVTVTAPVNLHQILYSSEYGKFINGFPSDFSVGYITNVIIEEDGKVVLPEVTTPGQQIVCTKIGTGTTMYVVTHANNNIAGQANISIKSYDADEYSSSVSLRSIVLDDESIEWIIIHNDGVFDFIDTSLVPGSSIVTRTITNEDLMLQPYELDFTGAVDATEILKGIVRLATEAEAQAGTATDIAVTPYGVKYWFDNYAVPFASAAEFLAGTATDKAITPAQAHLMETIYFPVTSGTEALTQNATGTYTYNIADFSGPTFQGHDIDTAEIRGLYVKTDVRSAGNDGIITAEYPDGTIHNIDWTAAYGSGDSTGHRTTVLVPIHKGQISIDLGVSLGFGATCSYEIAAVHMRTFE